MQQIIKISLNLVIITFVLFSSLKIYSENSETLKAKINSSVVNQINDSLSVNTKIKSVKISWIGFYPKVYLSNISISDNRDQILLNIPSGEVYINTINTFDSGKISIDKVIINDTKLNLKYDKNKIFFNKKNLVTKRSSEKQNNIPIIILNNSDIRLTNINSKQSISLKANNLFASYNDQILKIHSNFIHDSSQSPITINYEGKLLDGVLESKLFISGNSVKVPYHLLPEQMQQIKSSHMTLRVWLNLIDSNLVRASGNISTDILTMNIGESIFKMKNINSDLLYVKDKQSETLGFMRMNYEIDDTKINNNKIVIKKDKNKDIKIFLKKNNKKIFDEIMPMLSLNVDDFLNQTTLGNIENIQVHLSKEGNLDYYDLSINNFSLKYRDKYRFNNLSADMFGSLRRGKVKINTLSINDNGKNLLKDISGELFYASKGNSIYFSSSNFENNKGIKISFTGSKTSKTPSIKISIQSRLDDIVSNLNISDEFSTLEYDGMINTNIYYHADTIFSEIDIEDLVINNADVLYVSSSEIKLYTASTHIYSDKFDLSINDERFASRITTRSDSKSQKFILTSNGVLDIKKLKDHIDVKDLIDGKTKIKAVVTYDYHQKELSSFITSNLEGVKLNLMEPLNKTKNENANFILKYQHYPKIKYPTIITLAEHEFKFRQDVENLYSEIKSPIARGYMKYPLKITPDSTITGSFEYIDTNLLRTDGVSNLLPKLNIKSKYVKTSKAVLDDVHLILSPKNEYILIDKFSFNNLHLQMNSSGKWYRGNNEKTEIIADVKSDNLGKALSGLDYPNVLKGGNLEAKLNAQWNGSIEDFTFASTQGELQFTILNGQINELDKKTQAIGQVLGLLSISSIPKRLSLDFSDFFSKGLKFDNLKSDISLANGVADTKKMIILGSFGEMRLSGKSNLVEETHDQKLIFIPDLSSTSLVTGAVLGGPVGAAASIFYDRLLKEFGLDTNKLAGIEYSIKGPWKNPEIKVTQSFKPILN